VTLHALTPAADPRRAMPESSDERSWAIEAALASLRDEERRFALLGFEAPLACCHQQRRFWEFVQAVHALPEMRSAA